MFANLEKRSVGFARGKTFSTSEPGTKNSGRFRVHMIRNYSELIIHSHSTRHNELLVSSSAPTNLEYFI